MSSPYRHRSCASQHGRQGGGEVPVAGPVHLLDPGTQPGDGFCPAVGRELPPFRRRLGVVTVRAGAVRGSAGELGEGGCVLLEHPAVPGDLLAMGGELVQDRGDRVTVSHGQFQEKVPEGT